MGVATLLRFLAGDRNAIRRIAGSSGAPWVGLVFVLSAGLAREYDGESLLHEPWHLLIPLAASTALALSLYGLVYIGGVRPGTRRPRFLDGFRQFLALFWMTAPMAWLYAIPYERFLSLDNAIYLNVWTLGLVSVWRVVLIARVLSVFTRRSLIGVSILVLTFAWLTMGITVMVIPLPIIQFMGGIRMDAGERLLAELSFFIVALGIFAMIVLLPAMAAVLAFGRATWPRIAVSPRSHITGPLRILAALSILIWVFFLPFTQPQQQRRHRAEKLLAGGHIAEGLAFVASHPQNAFPPHWDPPPRLAYAERLPPLLDVVEIIHRDGIEGWIRRRYIKKFERAYLEMTRGEATGDWPRVERLLHDLPEGPSLLDRHKARIRGIDASTSRPTTAESSAPN